jgi:hypothetical protein
MAQRGGFLRIAVDLVSVDAVKPSAAQGGASPPLSPPSSVPSASQVPEIPQGAEVFLASLEDGPAIARRPGRLATGIRVGRGFRPGRLVNLSADGSQRFEWACRGGILGHLLDVKSWAVDIESVSLHPIPGNGFRAVAHVALSIPPRLWQRGRLEAKDAKVGWCKLTPRIYV